VKAAAGASTSDTSWTSRRTGWRPGSSMRTQEGASTRPKAAGGPTHTRTPSRPSMRLTSKVSVSTQIVAKGPVVAGSGGSGSGGGRSLKGWKSSPPSTGGASACASGPGGGGSGGGTRRGSPIT